MLSLSTGSNPVLTACFGGRLLLIHRNLHNLIVKEEVEEFFCHRQSTPAPKIYALGGKWGHIVQNTDGKIYLRVFYYSKAITSIAGYATENLYYIDFADYLLDEYLSHVRNRKIEKILAP